jgi:exoribonuclease II
METKQIALKKQDKETENAKSALKVLNAERWGLYVALLQDGLDCLIPASALEWMDVSQANVALAGTITSFIGGCKFCLWEGNF